MLGAADAGLQLRRELYQVRDQLGTGSAAAHAELKQAGRSELEYAIGIVHDGLGSKVQQRIAEIEQILAEEGDSLLTGFEMFKKEIGIVCERVGALEQTAWTAGLSQEPPGFASALSQVLTSQLSEVAKKSRTPRTTTCSSRRHADSCARP